MRKTLALLFLLILGKSAFAQQDPMFTNYLFNSLTFNPAYAGSNDHLTMNALYRTQWVGIEGAPVSQTVTVHSPNQSGRVGFGLNIIHDQIGPTNTLTVDASYAYRIPLGKGKLAIGLQGGLYNYRSDFSKLSYVDGSVTDPAYANLNPSFWKPNIGAGLYYSTKHFYTGLGVPHLIEYDLAPQSAGQTFIYGKQYRHYYFTMGGAIPLSGNALIFKPSVLIKSVSPDSRFKKDSSFQTVGAPTEFNVDLSLFFQETLWFGVSFRSAIEAFNNTSSFDSADVWAAYYLQNGLRIGAGYDYTLTKLNKATSGSFEIMLGYEFDYKTKKTVTPRYF